MERVIYLNGDYIKETEATVSVFDRDFLVANAVYEVSAVLDGKLVDPAGHLARLQRSWRAQEMTLPVGLKQLIAIH